MTPIGADESRAPSADHSFTASTEANGNVAGDGGDKFDRTQPGGSPDTAVDDEADGANLCGYGPCTPKWLQRLHNAACLLMTMSLCSIVQGIIVNGHLPASISTMERRYSLSSTQTGMIASSYDLAVVCVLVPVCHFGNHGHKGRWLALGMLLIALGALVLALPQFTTPPYQYAERRGSTVCRSTNSTSPPCTDDDSSDLSHYFYVFLLGQLLVGVGAAPLYTLGVAYLDESVTQRNSPVYLGVFTAFAVLGPAIGFILGGQLLRVWGDTWKSPPRGDLSTLGAADPRWYGAWWMGFLVCAVGAAVGGTIMMCFGRKLPGSSHRRAKDINQANAKAPEAPFSENLADLPKACLALLRNGTFTALIVMQTVEAFMLNAMTTFIPKVFENIYNMAPSSAAMLCGGILVPFGFVGNLLGGWLMTRFNLKCRGALILAIIFNILCIIFMPAFLLPCPQADFVGATVPYRGSGGQPMGFVRSPCNALCGCDDLYDPVCVSTTHTMHNTSSSHKHTFFSACAAGCQGSDSAAAQTQWSNCGCVPDERQLSSSSKTTWAPFSILPQLNNTAVAGLCPLHCGAVFYVSMALFAVLVVATFGSAMPVQQAMLRSVPFKQRSLALGLSWIFMRIFGSIPGAVLFGKAIDLTCSLAQRDSCGKWQSCLRYDTDMLALAVFIMGTVCTVIIIAGLVCALYLYTPPPQAISNERRTESTAHGLFMSVFKKPRSVVPSNSHRHNNGNVTSPLP